jgi:hypothetical protein
LCVGSFGSGSVVAGDAGGQLPLPFAPALGAVFGVCQKAMGDVREGSVMDTDGTSVVGSVDQVGEYEVPVDPMDELQCESCQ